MVYFIVFVLQAIFNVLKVLEIKYSVTNRTKPLLINSVLINNKITSKIEQNSIPNFDLIIIGNSIKKNEFNVIHKKFIKKNTKIINLTNFSIYNFKKNKIIYQPFV